MALLVPVMLLVAVSVAVTVWLPGCHQRHAERARAAGQRVVSRHNSAGCRCW